MNRTIRFAIYFALGLILLCFAWIFFLIKPAFIPGFNLQGKYQIGETIGGMTAPIVGIGSSVLLFLALMSQMRATEMQRRAFATQEMKNESDFIFSMFNQFLTELSFVNYNYDEGPLQNRINIDLVGLTALNRFVNRFCTTTMRDLAIGQYPQSRQILLLMDTLSSIQGRVESAEISQANRIMYTHKLNSYYTNFLHENLRGLVNTFDGFPTSAEEVANRVRLFFFLWRERNTVN